MKRNINIVCDSYKHIAENYDSVNVSQINNLVDCSVDMVLYYSIGYMEKSEAKNIFSLLTNKLRPGGSIIVKFSNLELLCQNYLQKKISNNDFLEQIKTLTNCISVDEIFTYVNGDKIRVTKIGKEKNNISMVVTRVAL